MTILKCQNMRVSWGEAYNGVGGSEDRKVKVNMVNSRLDTYGG